MKLALVFPGQGSQYVGMGRDMFEQSTQVQALFSEADRQLGYSLSKVILDGPEEELKKTSVTQPAILTVSVACLREFEARNEKPVAIVAGHSLGEYAALVAAGCLEFTDALRLVEKRGRFMEDAVPAGEGGMAAVLGLERELVDEACQKASQEGVVEAANYNCPGQIVISGTKKGLARAVDLCKELGAKRVIPLSVSGPFHSSLMTGAGEKLAGELDTYTVLPPQTGFINNVNADFIKDPAALKESLINQVSHSVLWEDVINKMTGEGVDTVVEIGPGKVLSGLIRKINRNMITYNIEDLTSLENTLAKMKEVI